MHRIGVSPSSFTFSSVLNACARLPAVSEGKQVHKRLLQSGHFNNKIVVSMIAGYGKFGFVKEARNVFDSIIELDASCWAAMLACYAQNGYAKEAVEMYMEMRAKEVNITDVAMVATVSACTQLGDSDLATTLAADIEERHTDRGVFVSNALIHMQAKCGSLDLAWKEFNEMKERDVITYSTMMAALADHGKSREALDMFNKMQDEGLRPNQVTFVSVLNACSHGGLIEEGCKSFELMTCVLGIKPLAEHLTCMVDLLGRAGQLTRAYNLMMNNADVVVSDAGIWGAFHAACRVHGNAEMGEMAARHLVVIDPEDSGNKVLLANAYASNSKWHSAEKVRKAMIEKRLKRSPGRSWILG
ncbi:Pentatricopeptide repeat-containing protein At2g03880, mitochondrial [Linum perenne]